MKMLKTLILALILPSLAIASEPWTKTEVALEAAYQVALVVDWKQTSEFHRTILPGENRVMKEMNPILGSHPSQGAINLTCLVSAVGHYLVSDSLNHKNRLRWQGATAMIEMSFVAHNYKLGVRVKW